MRFGSVLLVVLLGLATIPKALSADAQSGQSGESSSGRKIVKRVVPVEALVLANGNVKSIQVKGGNPLLAQAAQNALREWKWAKAERESTEMLEFRFSP